MKSSHSPIRKDHKGSTTDRNHLSDRSLKSLSIKTINVKVHGDRQYSYKQNNHIPKVKTKVVGPLDWSSAGLRLKYRDENTQNELQYSISRFKRSYELFPIQSQGIISQPQSLSLQQHLLQRLYQFWSLTENSLSISKSRSKTRSKKFYVDSEEFWMSDLSHLSEFRSLSSSSSSSSHLLLQSLRCLDNRRDKRSIENMDVQIQSVSYERSIQKAYHSDVENSNHHHNHHQTKVDFLSPIPCQTVPSRPITLPPIIQSLVYRHELSNSSTLSSSSTVVLSIDRLLPSADYNMKHSNTLWRLAVFDKDTLSLTFHVTEENQLVSEISSTLDLVLQHQPNIRMIYKSKKSDDIKFGVDEYQSVVVMIELLEYVSQTMCPKFYRISISMDHENIITTLELPLQRLQFALQKQIHPAYLSQHDSLIKCDEESIETLLSILYIDKVHNKYVLKLIEDETLQVMESSWSIPILGAYLLASQVIEMLLVDCNNSSNNDDNNVNNNNPTPPRIRTIHGEILFGEGIDGKLYSHKEISGLWEDIYSQEQIVDYTFDSAKFLDCSIPGFFEYGSNSKISCLCSYDFLSYRMLKLRCVKIYETPSIIELLAFEREQEFIEKDIMVQEDGEILEIDRMNFQDYSGNDDHNNMTLSPLYYQSLGRTSKHVTNGEFYVRKSISTKTFAILPRQLSLNSVSSHKSHRPTPSNETGGEIVYSKSSSDPMFVERITRDKSDVNNICEIQCIYKHPYTWSTSNDRNDYFKGILKNIKSKEETNRLSDSKEMSIFLSRLTETHCSKYQNDTSFPVLPHPVPVTYQNDMKPSNDWNEPIETNRSILLSKLDIAFKEIPNIESLVDVNNDLDINADNNDNTKEEDEVSCTEDSYAETLFRAVRTVDIVLLEDTLRSDSDVNQITDIDGNSLFLVACKIGSKRICKYLLRRGADVYAKNTAGDSCLSICKQNKHNELLQYLISKRADI